MILNQTVVYALRAMAILADLEPGESLRATELAERTGVPVHYLGKVMRRMVVAGLAHGRKGHGGGFALRRPPSRITFADVLAAADVAVQSDRCAFDWKRCDPDAPCRLHLAWTDLHDNLETWATTTTLASTRHAPAPPPAGDVPPGDESPGGTTR